MVSGLMVGGNSTVRLAVVLTEPRLLFAVQAYLPVSSRLGLLRLSIARIRFHQTGQRKDINKVELTPLMTRSSHTTY